MPFAAPDDLLPIRELIRQHATAAVHQWHLRDRDNREVSWARREFEIQERRDQFLVAQKIERGEIQAWVRQDGKFEQATAEHPIVAGDLVVWLNARGPTGPSLADAYLKALARRAGARPEPETEQKPVPTAWLYQLFVSAQDFAEVINEKKTATKIDGRDETHAKVRERVLAAALREIEKVVVALVAVNPAAREACAVDQRKLIDKSGCVNAQKVGERIHDFRPQHPGLDDDRPTLSVMIDTIRKALHPKEEKK